VNIGAPDLPRGWLVLGLFLALLATIGCSGKKPKDAQNDDRKSTAAASEHFDGGTYCVQTISRGPPVSQPVHFSNKQSESDGSSKDFESDLSSDKFDITFRERHRATSDDKPGSTPAVDNGPIHVPARNGYCCRRLCRNRPGQSLRSLERPRLEYGRDHRGARRFSLGAVHQQTSGYPGWD